MLLRSALLHASADLKIAAAAAAMCVCLSIEGNNHFESQHQLLLMHNCKSLLPCPPTNALAVCVALMLLRLNMLLLFSLKSGMFSSSMGGHMPFVNDDLFQCVCWPIEVNAMLLQIPKQSIISSWRTCACNSTGAAACCTHAGG